MNGILKKLCVNLGAFIMLHVNFHILDSTPLVTSFHFGNFGHQMLQSKLFSEWLNFYENPFFNIITIFAALHIIVTIFCDVIRKCITDK